MSAPKPPVALKNQCSIVHDGVIYVYSPDAFQTLELKEGAQWKQETNGVSVKGAVCVKGGVDGDNSKTALYVVGGAANASSSDYPGLQRFSITDKSWQTITPAVKVTQNRHNHGAAYMNTSSSILVYAGSQDSGYDGLSSETFVLETYPPYRVLAYSSTAPPTKKPIMLPWSEDRAFMAGGSSTNVNLFTFGPQDGWQDLGLSLPAPLPDSSVAQSAILTLDDNSKILQTFNLGQDVPNITSNVLLNAGGQLASFGETVGGSVPTSTPTASAGGGSKAKRDVFLNTYPSYNNSLAPSSSRTDFDLVQGENGLAAFVGGSTDSVAFFNQTGNSWISTTSILGKQEAISTPSTTQSPASASATSTPSSPAGSSSHKTNGLAILGGVLGGICGLAAILIIILLWLRSVRRKRERAEKQSGYGDDKKRSGEYNFEEQGLQPLARQGQPMGRSPVPSTVITEADSTAMVGNKGDPKYLIRRVSSERVQTPGYRGSGIGFGQALFKREKSPLSISKPMNPILGDYQARPSIELGRATPVGEPMVATVATPARKASQRKTDEGWGKYFQSEPQTGNRTMFFGRSSGASRGKSGFWPGSGVPESSTRSTPARSTKIVLRDSNGNPLQAHMVAAGSPTLEHGHPDPQSRGLQVAEGIPARISRASSVSTNSDEEYEDDHIEGAFSSGIPASVDGMPWTPVGNTWGGPAQRPLRPPSSYYQTQDMPLQTASSEETTGTQGSSIPSFPMPNSVRSMNPDGGSVSTAEAPAIRVNGHGQESRDYFSHTRARSGTPENNDMSWLNLGTPNR